MHVLFLVLSKMGILVTRKIASVSVLFESSFNCTFQKKKAPSIEYTALTDLL